MGLIQGQIPQQNFELIRDNIGAILAFELPDQVNSADVVVWNNRSISFDKSELPAVNVSFPSAAYDQHDPNSRRATNQYFIDVHTSGKNKVDADGDSLAALKCEQIAGIVSYILSSGEYVRLGLPPGIIASRRVLSITMGSMDEGDALHSIACRVVLEVISQEIVGNISGTPLDIITTKIQIEETDKGFYFVNE